LRAGPLLAPCSFLSAAKNHISPCGGHDDELLSFGVAILARLGNRRIRRFVIPNTAEAAPPPTPIL
jgi:hypothetical protein